MKPISKISYEAFLQKLILKPISKINYETYLQNELRFANLVSKINYETI